MLNRAVARLTLFEKAEDYEAFERVLKLAVALIGLPVFSYIVMPNHWHFVVRPETDSQVTDFFRWLTHTHTMRWHAHYHTEGTGHLYQGRFKAFPIEEEEYLLNVLRYVERNALRASLTERAEDWKYGSMWRRVHGSEEDREIFAPWPVDFFFASQSPPFMACDDQPASIQKRGHGVSPVHFQRMPLRKRNVCLSIGCPAGFAAHTAIKRPAEEDRAGLNRPRLLSEHNELRPLTSSSRQQL